MAYTVAQARLAIEVAGRMSATPPQQLRLLLRKLEIAGLEPKAFDPWDLEDVIHDFVDSLDTEQISHLAEYYGVDTLSESPSSGTLTSQPEAPIAFISYDSADKSLAGEISDELRRLGVRNFLAHRDIESGTDWRNELMGQLDGSKAMVCLIGENYHQKPICSQEIGWAWSRKIPIVPCSIHTEVQPSKMGFIEGKQFVQHRESVQSTALEILDNLVNKSNAAEIFIDELLDWLSQSTNFEMAKLRWRSVARVRQLSLTQVAKLVRVLNDNYQLQGANFGRLEAVIKAKIADWSPAAD